MTVDDVSIEDIYRYYGGDLPRSGGWGDWVSVRCPWHNDTQASGSLNRKRNAYNCHACDVRGGPVDVVKTVEGFSTRKDAVEWIERRFG